MRLTPAFESNDVSDVKILNVDDNEPARYAVSRMLRHEGFQVIEAATGSEALRLAADRPDLVLLDVNLPDMSGLEVCRKLRTDPTTAFVPIVHTSATFAETEHRVQGLLGGADAYLAGPIDPSELVASIHALLRIKRAEESARASEQRVARVLDGITDCYYHLDKNWRLTAVNHRAEDFIFSRPAEQLLGGKLWDEYPETIDSEFYKQYHKTAITGSPAHFEAFCTVSRRWLEAHAYPDEDGLAVYLRDITDRKRLEEEQRNTSRKLSEADARKDEFLAMLGHELRNPLGVISNIVNVLSSPRGQLQDTCGLVPILARQTRQLTRLVDDLLDVSRISRGLVQLRTVRTPISPIIESALESASLVIEERGHHLSVALPVDPIWVEADPERLEQVVFNLLNNAAKYTDPGGQIFLSVERQETDALIKVRDTGIGIDPKNQPDLFSLFFQADRGLDRSKGGLGIGLSLVKTLAEMHHGTVSVHSEGLGKGSEFVVRIPAAPSPQEDTVPGPPPPAAADTRCLRVLIVDDNADAAHSLTELLQLWGHEVHVAKDGEEALSLAASICPDAVLLDIGLPGIDGYEVARRLRSISELTIIALSGFGDKRSRDLSRAAGIEHHLTKPVDTDQLRHLLTSGER